ncbi:MAG: DUF503 family protein [Candidatus Promineifilaceae bacterium]
MSNEEIPVQAIADLLERKPKEIKRVYDEWLASRKGRKDPLVPDIKLLASLTGLSTASVSNHLRNKPGSLSEGKAQRLSQLIELVGYVPSSAAQSLRGRHSNVIGIAVPLSTVSPDFHLEVLSGIKREADLLGYQQFIFDVTTIEARDEFFGSMPFLGIVDGLIVIGLYIDEARLRILNRHRLKGTIEKVRAKFNVSATETGHQDSHQSAQVGVAMVNSDRLIIEQVLSRVEEFFADGDGLIVSDSSIEWL